MDSTLTIQLFFWATGVPVALEAYKARGRARIALWAVAGVFGIAGFVWPFVNEKWASIGTWLGELVANPSTWFILAVTVFFVLRPLWTKPATIPRLDNEADGSVDFDAMIDARLDEFLATKLRAEFATHVALHAHDERFEQVDERLERQLVQIATHAAQIFGLQQDIEKRFTSLDYAISAIGHRDVILIQSAKLEAFAEQLNYPKEGTLADDDAWSDWELALSKWETSMQHWLVHASPYLKEVGPMVENVPDDWYERDWQIGPDDFPSLAALRRYQRWEGKRINWENARGRVLQLVTAVAFHGELPFGAKETSNG